MGLFPVMYIAAAPQGVQLIPIEDIVNIYHLTHFCHTSYSVTFN